jgi:hypothetical protein
VTISRLVNAFFGWECNSCETLVRGDAVFPIDYANASPDIALTSLHDYFPWPMSALVKWSAFCLVTARRPRLDLDTRRYFEVGDREDLTYEEKLEHYRRLADDYFDVDRYSEFCATQLADFDAMALAFFASRDLDDVLVETVRTLYPPHEHEALVAHVRGLLGAWVRDQGASPAWAV